jgi:hypothetical protein
MVEELFYTRNPTLMKGRKPIVPMQLYNDLKNIVETFENTPLPFIYSKKQEIFHDVMLNLVNEEVIFPKTSWCGFYRSSTFSYVIRNKQSLKNMMIQVDKSILMN